MNTNRLLGLVGAFVVMFGLGGLWHQVLSEWRQGGYDHL